MSGCFERQDKLIASTTKHMPRFADNMARGLASIMAVAGDMASVAAMSAVGPMVAGGGHGRRQLQHQQHPVMRLPGLCLNK